MNPLTLSSVSPTDSQPGHPCLDNKEDPGACDPGRKQEEDRGQQSGQAREEEVVRSSPSWALEIQYRLQQGWKLVMEEEQTVISTYFM